MKGKILLYISWGVALVGMLLSLYFSEIQQLAPCVLCWYQRICLYPLVLLLPVGLLKKDKNVVYYVLPLSLIGALIAFYHSLLQAGIIPEKLAPCQAGISCATVQVNLFGFLTIPLMSFFAFAIVSFCMIFFFKKNDR